MMDDAQDERDHQLSGGEEEEDLYDVLFAPITSRINALGGLEDAINEETGDTERLYRLGDECLGCLRDLKKFWRKFEEDEDRTVARIFHEAGLMANDLLPILHTAVASGEKGRKIALACADLMMAMTWPINVVEELQDADLRGELENTNNRDFRGLLAIQLGYKGAILRAKAIPALFSIILPILEIPKLQRRQKDDNIIMLVLHIFRNLAAIKDKPSSTYHSTESLEQSSLQSELIVQMHQASVFEFLTTLAAMSTERDYRKWILIVLDIFHLVFRSVKAAELVADVEDTRKNKLSDLLLAEKQTKRVDSRKGATRHSRFGTTVTLNAGDKKYVMHKQAAVFKSPSKIIDQSKKGAAKKFRIEDDLGRTVELRPTAVKALQQVALAFLESAFNPFVESMIREMKHQLEGSKELDCLRFLVLASLFLEYFNILQKEEKQRGIAHDSEEGHDFDLVAEMMTDTGVALPMARMIVAFGEKPPNWTELHASVDCLTQCLLTMEALAQSPLEEYREVGDVLQHKFYYEPEPLDRMINIIGTYKSQSKKYLDSIIHLSYVLLRMLEQYSKTNAFMHIKRKKKSMAKKKRARRQRQEEGEENEIFQINSSDDEEAQYEQSQVEAATHLFQFSSFEARFASEGVLATCMAYLASYPTFTSDEQMKRLVSLMHRLAVRAKADGLFFKTSALSMFNQILDDRQKLPKSQSYEDLVKLIDFIIKRFFKLARTNPLMLLETFFPTRKSDINKMIDGRNIFDLDDDAAAGKSAKGGGAGGETLAGNGLIKKGKQTKSTRRKRAVASDGELQSEDELDSAKVRRQKRKAEVAAAFKSAQFIDSDDDKEDDERDRAFFAREMELREKRTADLAAGTAPAPSQPKKKKRKKNDLIEAIISEAKSANKRKKAAKKQKSQPSPANTPSLATSDSRSSPVQSMPSTPSSEMVENSTNPVSSPAGTVLPVDKHSRMAARRIADSDDE